MTTTHTTTLIYKIADRESWDRARQDGVYRGSPDDLRDGYLHFSTAPQAIDTAAKHFSRREGLIIAAVGVADLGPSLKWEPSRGGQLFPHLYAPLPMTCVRWTRELPVGVDGAHQFPVEVV